MTIPGIGYYSALLVKSEIGTVDRFPDGEEAMQLRWTGSVRRYLRPQAILSITKEGSRWLRWIMVESVHTHLKYDTSITRVYHAIAERKGCTDREGRGSETTLPLVRARYGLIVSPTMTLLATIRHRHDQAEDGCAPACALRLGYACV